MNNTEQLAWIRAAAAAGRIQSIREEARVSRAEMARDVGVAEATIDRWETGMRVPTGDVALRYATVMRRLERAGKRQAVAQ